MPVNRSMVCKFTVFSEHFPARAATTEISTWGAPSTASMPRSCVWVPQVRFSTWVLGLPSLSSPVPWPPHASYLNNPSAQRGAKFHDACAYGLHGHGKRQRGGFVHKENDAVEFALASPPGQRQPDGMKQVAAAHLERLLQVRHNLLETVRGERLRLKQQQGELPENFAGGITGKDGVGFRGAQDFRGVVAEHQS